jgi:hypothetical protein
MTEKIITERIQIYDVQKCVKNLRFFLFNIFAIN